MLNVRKAVMADLEEIMQVYGLAQDFMIRAGNPDQWGHFYPDRKLISDDIQNGFCKIIGDENGICGVFAAIDGIEPTYRLIEDGGWLNDDPYITIHRIAGNQKAHGLFRVASDYCKSLSENVRIDTHKKNTIMQRQIEKNGFKKCGIIYVTDGSPRIAYHWTAL